MTEKPTAIILPSWNPDEPRFIVETCEYPIAEDREFRNNNYRFSLYSVDILPEVADDNNPLRRIIYSKIELGLPKCFKKVFFT